MKENYLIPKIVLKQIKKEDNLSSFITNTYTNGMERLFDDKFDKFLKES